MSMRPFGSREYDDIVVVAAFWKNTQKPEIERFSTFFFVFAQRVPRDSLC